MANCEFCGKEVEDWKLVFNDVGLRVKLAGKDCGCFERVTNKQGGD